MKNVLVTVLLILIVSPISSALSDDRKSEGFFEQAFMKRMKVLENFHGIKFDANWQPKVTFAVPDYLPEELYDSWSGLYDIETQSFFLRPSHKNRSIDLDNFKGNVFISRGAWKPGTNLRTLIDHELGHYIPDQISRLYGYGEWPKNEFVTYKYGRKIAIKLIMEGIATYFELTSVIDKYYCGKDIWPVEISSLSNADYNEAIFYYGGYCLVEPIVRHYGERGILYLITNPPNFKTGKLWQIIEQYQANALYVLSQ